MAKLYIVRLTEEERGELQRVVRVGRQAAYRVRHAQILLAADQAEGAPALRDEDVAKALGVHENTVANIRRRFVEAGLKAALDRKPQVRPSRRRKLDGRAEAILIATACGDPPEGRAAWTLQLLADRMVELKLVDSISHEAVRQVLKKTNSSRT